MKYKKKNTTNQKLQEGNSQNQGKLLLLKAQHHIQQTEYDQAQRILTQIIVQFGRHPEVIYTLGCIAFSENKHQEALNYFEETTVLQPRHDKAFNNKGITLESLSQNSEALIAYQTAIEINPEYAEAYANCGTLLLKQNRSSEAMECLTKALQLDKNAVKAYNGIGLYKRLQKSPDAITYFQKALMINPQYLEAMTNLGSILIEQLKFTEAVAVYRKALTIHPNNMILLNNLGHVLLKCGKATEALPCFKQAMKDAGNNIYPIYDNYLLTLHYIPNIEPTVIFDEHQCWAEQYDQPLIREKVCHAQRGKEVRTKLKIGYVSPDFREHSVAYFLAGVLSAHQREYFVVYLYSSVQEPDHVTRQFQDKADVWQDITRLTDQQASELIRRDGIDILVDLAGHTANSRLPLFAYKPAPIQVTWLGYPDTTGLPTMDYRMTDVYADPPGYGDRYYSEKLVRLPRSFLCYSPREDCPALLPPPVLSNQRITFGSFNNLAKLTPQIIILWATVLRAVPHSHLVLKAPSLQDVGVRHDIFAQFAQQDIAAERIELKGRQNNTRGHFAEYQGIDIALDTFPYHGTTTTCEALWMGVPVVTLKGNSHVSRVGVSLLTNVGLSELIANNETEYIAIAVKLAKDVSGLTELRTTMRARMTSSTLLDNRGFTATLEAAYDQMWKFWQMKGCSMQLSEQDTKLEEQGEFMKKKKNKKAIVLKPEPHIELHDQGILFKEKGNTQEAISCLLQSLESKPDYISAHYNLVLLYREQGQWEEAINHCMKILNIDPSYVEAHKIAGALLKGRGNASLAEKHLRHALLLQPNGIDTLNTLGNLLTESGRVMEAITVFEKAIALNENDALTYCNFGSALARQGKAHEALASFRHSLRLNPQMDKLHSNILLALAYLPDADAQSIFAEHLQWAKQHAEALYPEKAEERTHPYGEKIRIGYVSPDFRRHSVGYFIEPVLLATNRKEFEIVLYSDVRFPDLVTERFKTMADLWRDISCCSHQQVYDAIRQDHIDILVDLAGHTANNRLMVFARKPAPVQLTWIGYPNTTGLANMDYRLTDQYADPEGMTEKYYTEKLVRLPNSFLCYRPGEDSPAVAELPAIVNRHITFGSFNNFNKVSAQVIGLWAEVLKAVPGSCLVLKSGGLGDATVQQNVMKRFVQLGIRVERIKLLGHAREYNKHLAVYDHIDIALDTFPYHGTTTTCEALWMGVPVLTLAGNTHVSRVGVSLLTNLGLPGLVASTPEEYIRKAVAMSADLGKLGALRRTLRPRMVASPLMQVETFTQNLENEYRRMCGYSATVRATDSVVTAKQEDGQKIAIAQAEDCIKAGRTEEATEIFTHILEQQPEHSVALHGLGLLLSQRPTQLAQGIKYLERAVQAQPGYIQAMYNLALVFQLNDKVQEAKDMYHKVVDTCPQHINTNVNLATIYEQEKDISKAEHYLRQALSFAPDNVDIINKFALLLFARKKYIEAMFYYRKGLALNPQDAATLNNLGVALSMGGDLSTALQCYRQALEIDPSRLDTFSNLLLLLNYMPNWSPAAVFAEHQKFGEYIAHSKHLSLITAHQNDKVASRPLRIGYVSPDFRKHSAAYFIETILEKHDKAHFEIILYSNSKVQDDVTQRIRHLGHGWREIKSLTDQEVVQMIMQDKIDILVDLAGHTLGGRLSVFAQKPAPIQVSWIGYPNTSGLKTMDYRLSDGYADPLGMTEAYYTESLIRLSSSFLCYKPSTEAPPVNSLPALKANGITFGSFNNFAKITPQLLALWARILKAVPRSRLVLKSLVLHETEVQDKIKASFARQGINPNRILLSGQTASFTHHMEAYHHIDIALDCYPYHGTTTTYEALWMGVPVVTLAGQSHVSRVGVSILTNIGLPELVAHTEEEYVAIAVKLASNVQQLAWLRERLRVGMARSPLMDGTRITQEVENIYQQIWLKWVEDNKGLPAIVTPVMSVPTEFVKKHYRRADRCKKAGKYEEAAIEYAKVLDTDPNFVPAYGNLAVMLQLTGRGDEALPYYAQAVKLDANDYAAFFNRGMLFKEYGRIEEGIADLQQSIKIKGDYGLAVVQLAELYKEKGNLEEALATLHYLIKIEPQNAEVHKMIGRIYKGKKQPLMTELYFRKALELDPHSADTINELAVLLELLGKTTEAATYLEKAISLWPDDPCFYNNLGALMRTKGETRRAVACFQKALELNPTMYRTHSNLLFTYNCIPGMSAERIFAEHQQWNERFAVPLQVSITRHSNEFDIGRRLKIGYVSPDFRKHAVASFIEPVLSNHDKKKVEIFLYNNFEYADETTIRLKGLADGWRDIVKLSDEQVAQLIRQDQIDILVDLSGHTAGHRLLVFARRPAPVQVTWIGYPNTTGMTAMDYRITDAFADPLGQTDCYYTEKLVRLPHSFLCFQPMANSPTCNNLPALNGQGITFGSFNNVSKITPQVLNLWVKILNAVPNSRLFLKFLALSDSTIQQGVIAAFAQRGIAPERLKLTGQTQAYYQHLADYHSVDIALDTFPYNGTTTTCEALWMGVPVVTIAGDAHVSRVGVSLLNNLGLPELVAKTEEEYVAIAVNLSSNLSRLNWLREHLREGMTRSPLMQAEKFTQELEHVYQDLWGREVKRC